METLELLQDMGLVLPIPAYIAGLLLFGVIGIAAFFRGRRVKSPAIKWTGVALMFYPYVVWQTWMLWAVGVGLCVWLYTRWE